MKPDDRLRLSRFSAGDSARVRSGAFESFDGVVNGIDWPQMKLRVAILIFGRETIIEMPPGDVEKT
jgi:transcription termination/antitermination protein NusG